MGIGEKGGMGVILAPMINLIRIDTYETSAVDQRQINQSKIEESVVDKIQKVDEENEQMDEAHEPADKKES